MKKVNWDLETINNNFVELPEDSQFSTTGGFSKYKAAWEAAKWLFKFSIITVDAPDPESYYSCY